MKANLLVFSQNIKLDSLTGIRDRLDPLLPTVAVTTHKLFGFEIEQIRGILGDFTDLTFADLITDSEMERCDREACEHVKTTVGAYYDEIKKLKNEIIFQNLSERYDGGVRLLLCDDLGIDADVWVTGGFERVRLSYYYEPGEKAAFGKKHKKGILKYYLDKPVFSARRDGKKIVFYGRMHRIGYRLDLDFKRDKGENLRFVLARLCERVFGRCPVRRNVLHITTIHELNGWAFPKSPRYRVGVIQDGYLPPNYSSMYLTYVNDNMSYYAWDTLGMQVFRNQGIPVSMLPYRKQLPMPEPVFRPIRTVLCIASGAGDWTAMKNRSDEDQMILAFVEIARRHPDIRFVYRCHPVWVHPNHQGVNSIHRVAELFAWSKLPNIVLSANIPEADISRFQLSYARSSLESDLATADVVFGEHSVSMIDATFGGLPFASVNVTGRRDFFCGMTALGFPHCESIEDIDRFIGDFETDGFQTAYRQAVARYNDMTKQEG